RPDEPVHFRGWTREVEPRVVVVEEALVVAVALHGRLVTRREARERGAEHLDHGRAEVPVELVRLAELADRQRLLREDRTGVELRVHAMERDGELPVAVTDTPTDRHRPAVTREQRRVTVEPAEPRHRERSR